MKINCYCGETLDFDIPETLDLEASEELQNSVIKGNFLVKICPTCGKVVKPEITLNFLYNQGISKLGFIPELERSAFLSGEKAIQASEVVIGYPELVEWVKIHKASLDRRAVEIIKYYLLKKTENPEKISLFFNSSEGENLTFHLYGLKPEEIGVSRIPLATYQKILKDLPRLAGQEPFLYFITPPYVSVTRVALEKEE